MRDLETGSWWQQVTGEAIQGPLKGQRLEGVFHDELTFGLWKGEQPDGRVLKPNDEILKAEKYAPANWEQGMSARPVTTSFAFDKSIAPRTLVVGVTIKPRRPPLKRVGQTQLILDDWERGPVFLVVGKDKKSCGFRKYGRGRKAGVLSHRIRGVRPVDAETEAMDSQAERFQVAAGNKVTNRGALTTTGCCKRHPKTWVYELATDK